VLITFGTNIAETTGLERTGQFSTSTTAKGSRPSKISNKIKIYPLNEQKN